MWCDKQTIKLKCFSFTRGFCLSSRKEANKANEKIIGGKIGKQIKFQLF